MGRRGPELSPQLRARICELRSLGWPYNRICEKYLEILRSTIGGTCRNEAKRLNNFSNPQSGARTGLVPMEGDPESARGGVTTRVSKEVLNQHLPPILQFGAIFMHDNALIHTAHIIKDWLQENGVLEGRDV
jgi:hypothetical protein